MVNLTCKLCSKPIDLTTDTVVDEDGKPVHEACYAVALVGIKLLTEESGMRPIIDKAEELRVIAEMLTEQSRQLREQAQKLFAQSESLLRFRLKLP